ncbi:MAG: glycoside hydrolase family 18 protein [Acidimicrobiales bacterium]
MPALRRPALLTVAVIGFVIVVTVAGLFGAGAFGYGHLTTTTSVPPVTSPIQKYAAGSKRVLAAAISSLKVHLPAHEGAPAPVLTPGALRGIRPHQVVGFLPSYELGSLGSLRLSSYTTIVYSSVDLLASGALGHGSDGWRRLADGAVGPLLQAAHRAGTEVLLGLSAVSESVIGPVTANADSSAVVLLKSVIPVLQYYGFDGVDLDVEGQSASDRQGYSAFVAELSKGLHATRPSWRLMVNTYPQSVVDPTGFCDAQALAPSADELFVMAYDMSDLEVPSATAPLTGAPLSDVSVAASYAAAGLANKSILGMPFYGYDFPASRGRPPAVSTGTAVAVTYDSIVAAGRPALWDPVTDTAFSSFRRAGRWHQTWFDDPVSVALKTAVAVHYGFLGVGAWEIGMAVAAPQMTEALDGGAAVVRLPLAGSS